MSKKQFEKWLNTPVQDDPAFDAGFDEACKLGEIEDEEVGLKEKLDKLRFGVPDVAEMERIEARLPRLKKKKAALMGKSTGSTKQTEAQQRKAELRNAVRKRMQEQYDRGDRPNRKQALQDISDSGELHKIGYWDGASIDGKKITNPMERAYKDTHGVTIKPCSTE